MNIGQPADTDLDFTGSELESMNWTAVNCSIPYDNPQLIDWMRENFNDFANEVRWHHRVCIYFRRQEEAIQFKLRWL